MTAHPVASSRAEALAGEAARYLEVVETFASLGADPHAAARARAARARRLTDQAAQTASGRRRRWRP
jgi:hypothetical protein